MFLCGHGILEGLGWKGLLRSSGPRLLLQLDQVGPGLECSQGWASPPLWAACASVTPPKNVLTSNLSSLSLKPSNPVLALLKGLSPSFLEDPRVGWRDRIRGLLITTSSPLTLMELCLQHVDL